MMGAVLPQVKMAWDPVGWSHTVIGEGCVFEVLKVVKTVLLVLLVWS
jgi:hypothetical protein